MNAIQRKANRASSSSSSASARVRGYWNRPRSADASVELDLVAWNLDDRVVRFGSCKRRSDKHDAQVLGRFRAHVERFVASTGHRFAGWRREYVLFSPQFGEEQRTRLEAEDWICRDISDLRRSLAEADRGERGRSRISPKVLGED